MNILVTGAAGFIGRALCDYLSANKHSPYALIRKSCEDLKAKKKFVVPNVLEQGDWRKIFKGIDSVVHTIGLAHVKGHQEQDYYDINLELTKKIALECVKADVKRFVFISSMAVYGEAFFADRVTLSTSLRPTTAYGHSKVQAEQFLLDLQAKGDLDVVIVRPPIVYGAMCPGNIHLLIKAIKHNLPLPFAGVRNLRSMVYVDNLCDALVTCALSPNAPGHIFLVSYGEDISIETLICILAKGLNKSSKLFPFSIPLLRRVFKLVRKEDVLMKIIGSFRIDIQDIQEKLGWEPIVGVRDGLMKTAQSYR